MAIFGEKKPTSQKHSTIEVIEYDGSNDVLIWKYPNEDFNANTQLIVSPAQEAIFVKGGQVLERFEVPGIYTLSTKNYPFIRSLVTGEVTVFSCEVYFVSRVLSMVVKWGTRTPVSIVDPVYNVPVNIRSHGDLSLQIENGQMLFEKLVGQIQSYTHEELTKFFSNLMSTQAHDVIFDTIMSHALSPTEICTHLTDMSSYAIERIGPIFEPYGMAVNHFTIAHIGIPESDIIKIAPHVMQAQFRKTDIGVEAEREAGEAQHVKHGLSKTELQEMVDHALQANADLVGPIMGGAFENIPRTIDNSTTDGLRLSTVQFSAIAPERFQKGFTSTVDILMYEEDHHTIVDSVKAEYEQTVKESRSGIQKVQANTKVRVLLSSSDIELDDFEDEQKWCGGYLRFSFFVELPKSYSKAQLRITAQVYFNDVPATRLIIVAECGRKKAHRIKLERLDINSGFMSYASQDRARVAAIVQGMQKVRPDLHIFFDVESLRSGDNWQEVIQRTIDQCDTLFLCWSHFANESKWVDWEWHYALQHKGESAIDVFPIESPDICPPPEALNKKHFNDKLLVYMNSDVNASYEQQKMFGLSLAAHAGYPGRAKGEEAHMVWPLNPGIAGSTIVQPTTGGAEKARMKLEQQPEQQHMQDHMGMMAETMSQPAAQASFKQKAKKIKFLRDSGIITQNEYQEMLVRLMSENGL